jgi:hypothetical protein
MGMNGFRITTAMTSLLLIYATLGREAAAQVTLEDWSCYQITNATPVAGGRTNLTCNAAHGWTTGTSVIIYGATGSWAPLDTQLWNRIANPLPIGPSDITIQVNDTRYLTVPGFVELDAEVMYVTSVDSDHLYLGPGAGCATGRGCRGTTATSHPAQDSAGWIYNYNGYNPITWTVTVVDPVTIQIGLDSSPFGSFAGQTVYIRRTQNPGTAAALGQVYLGQPWASYDDVTANGLQITIPACTNSANAFLCAKGFLTIKSSKGYSFTPGGIPISSFIVSGTPPNQIATVTFATPHTQPAIPGANTLRAVSSASSWGYAGALVWIDGLDETSTGLNSLNRPYLIQSMTTVGSTVTQVVLAINDGPATVPNGPYIAAANSVFNCSTRPCMAIPWPGDPYTDFNLPNATYPNGTIQQYIKYGTTWNPSFNRLRVQYQWNGINQGFYPSGYPMMDLGGYIYDGTDPGDSAHTYQDAGAPVITGQWAQVEWPAMFEHIVGSNNNYLYANEAALNGGWFDTPPSWDGGARPFWTSMGRMYWDWSGPPATTPPLTGGTLTYRSIILDETDNEPFEYVHGIGVAYDGSKYQIGWIGPRQNYAPMGWTLPVSYNVVYSTSDLKTTGFSNGTLGGAVRNSAGAGDAVYYASPAMAQANTIYFGIRPVVPIWAVSPNGASPIWFWSMADYGLDATSHITTTGVGGTGDVNNAPVNSVQPRQFWTLYQPQTNVPWTTPGSLTSITSDGSGNCTVHLNGVSHNLAVGWPVLISNPPAPTLFGNSNSAAVFNVSSTPTPSTFVFSCPNATPNTTWDTDTFQSPYWYHFAVMSLPGVSVSGTASLISPSSPTMVAADDTKNFTQVVFSPPSNSCTISTSSLPKGAVGAAYSQTLQASKCASPLTWSVVSGSLCAGLSLAASSGAITGTPTTAQQCSMTVQVTDSASHTASQPLSMTVLSPCDINGDGVVNATDIGLAQSMALGQATCTADLDQSGQCTVVDVQRVIDAISGTCKVGP